MEPHIGMRVRFVHMQIEGTRKATIIDLGVLNEYVKVSVEQSCPEDGMGPGEIKIYESCRFCKQRPEKLEDACTHYCYCWQIVNVFLVWEHSWSDNSPELLAAYRTRKDAEEWIRPRDQQDARRQIASGHRTAKSWYSRYEITEIELQ